MRLSSRRGDDADVIRARLRALLDESNRSRGWVPDLEEFDDEDWPDEPAGSAHPDPAADALPTGLGRHRSPGRGARWDPGRPGARSLWVAGLLAVLLLVGWTWLDRPRIERVSGTADISAAPGPATSPTPSVGEVAETTTTVVVAVIGSVSRPGLVTLPAGSRVADAIEAAGGLLPNTDASSVNLAAVVADGQQIAVGVPGALAGQANPPGTASTPGTAGRVNLNSATVAELDALPGLGPVLAQRIIDHRSQNGPFTGVDQLDDVPGIGPATAAELADLVTV